MGAFSLTTRAGERDKETASPAEDSSAADKSTLLVAPDYQKVTAFSALALALFACCAVLYMAKPVLFPIVLAAILNLLLSPSVRSLKKAGVPNPLAALLVMTLTFGILIFSFTRLVKPASVWLERAPSTFSAVERKLKFIKEPIQEISEASEKFAQATEIAHKRVTLVKLEEPVVADAVLTVTGTLVAQLMVATVLLYFLLSAGDRFLTKLVEVMPRLTDKKKVVEITRSVEDSVSVYLRSVALINTGLGICVGTAMWLLEMPNPVLWGVMAAVLNFVPYLGSATGLIVIAVVSLVTFESPLYALSVPMVYFILDSIEGAIVTPLLLGFRLDLSPPIILMWLLLWGWLWGIPGLLLAVPMLAALKILCDHVETLKPLGTFLVR